MNKKITKILLLIFMIISFTLSKTFAFENENFNLMLKGFKENGYILDCNDFFLGSNNGCDIMKSENEIIINKDFNNVKIIKKGEINYNLLNNNLYNKELIISKYKSSEKLSKELLNKIFLLQDFKYVEKKGMKIFYKVEIIKGLKKKYLNIQIFYKNTIFSLTGLINDKLKKDLKNYGKIIKKLKEESYFKQNNKYIIFSSEIDNYYFIDKNNALIINYDNYRSEGGYTEIEKELSNELGKFNIFENFYSNVYYKDKYKIISKNVLSNKKLIDIKNELDNIINIME